MMLYQTMKDIVSNGGGLIVDLNKQMILPQSLIELSLIANASGATLIIKGTDKILATTLIDIAISGKNNVIIEN